MGFYVVNNTRFDDNGFSYGEKFGKISRGEALKCEVCGSFLTGLKWLPPLEVKLSRGKLGDVIYGTFDHFIVSEKFKELYCKNGFKGIRSFEPVTIYQKGKRITGSYYYPKIVLSNCHIDIEKSGIVFKGIGECPVCQKAGRIIKDIKGLYFSNEDEIKEDVFCTKILPGDVIFSRRFREAAESLLNLSFTDSTQYTPSWVL